MKFPHNDYEAIAIYQNQVIDLGSIPYIFSNYRGFKDYNAQGNQIANRNDKTIKIGKKADGIIVFVDQPTDSNIIWEMENNKCIIKNIKMLDPHWGDH